MKTDVIICNNLLFFNKNYIMFVSIISKYFYSLFIDIFYYKIKEEVMKPIKEKKNVIFFTIFVIILLLCSSIPLTLFNQQVKAAVSNSQTDITCCSDDSHFISYNSIEIDETQSFNINSTNNYYLQREANSFDPDITITYPATGYLYFPAHNINRSKFLLKVIKWAIVIDNILRVDVDITGINHIRFETTKILTGQKTAHTQYNVSERSSGYFFLKTGLYKVTVIGYDENEIELKSESIKVFFIRSNSQRKDFGIWINTKYQNTVTNTKLDIGVSDFIDMIEKKEWRQYNIKMENTKDTTLSLRFTKDETITFDGESVALVQVQFNLLTSCNTMNDYSVYLEARIPYSLFNTDSDTSQYTTDLAEPYYAARIGFSSNAGNKGPSEVNARFCFGKDNFRDPIALLMEISPDNAGQSNVIFFGSLLTVDEYGNEAFRRNITIEFCPAAMLQITFIPRDFRISYKFGDSAGVFTRISFRTDGKPGLFNSLAYSMTFNPLPAYMVFDLNAFQNENIFEFHYSSDAKYNIIFSLDSDKSENFMKFELSEVPKRIDIAVGMSFLKGSDPSGYFNLNMSEGIDECSLTLQGENSTVLLQLTDVPAHYRSSCIWNLSIGKGSGDIKYSYDGNNLDDIAFLLRIIKGEWIIQGDIVLRNNDITLSWDVDVDGGTGRISYSRVGSGISTVSGNITKTGSNGWTLLIGGFDLNRDIVSISWNANSVSGSGYIVYSCGGSGGNPVLYVVINKGEWSLQGNIVLRNTAVNLSWENINIGSGTGQISYSRIGSGFSTISGVIVKNGSNGWTLHIDGAESDQAISVTITKGELIIQGTITLQNSAINLSWDVDVDGGTGRISYSRVGSGISTVSGNITKTGSNGWTLLIGGFDLNRDIVSISWNANSVSGSGYIVYSCGGSGGNPVLYVVINKGEWSLQGNIVLRNTAVNLSWENINIGSGTGQISYSRIGSGISTVSGNITKTGSNGWTMLISGFELKRDTISMVWNIDTEQRQGYIHFYQNDTSEPITLTIKFIRNDWSIEDTLKLQSNHHFFIEWKLPTSSNPSSFFKLECDGSVSFSNMISIKQGSIEIFRIEGELQIENSFSFGWNYNANNDPINFYISGHPRKAIGFFVKVNYNNFDFIIQTSWELHQPKGSISFQFNKPIKVTVTRQNPFYLLNLELSLSANRQISVQWNRAIGTYFNPGYFLIKLGGSSSGCSNLNLIMKFDPDGNYNYNYGFDIGISGSFHTGGSDWGREWWLGVCGYLPRWRLVGNLYGNAGLYVSLFFNGNWYDIINPPPD